MNLVLIGYRGSGKSTVGRMLAERLGMSFVDTDDLVVESFNGMTIRQIWERHGEAEFRAAESDVTERVMAGDNQVIALGGGTVMQQRAQLAVMGAPNAVRFYLRGPAELLHQRITGDAASRTDRPSLTDLDGGLAEVQRVLAEREPTYLAVADHVVDLGHDPPGVIVERIVRGVGSAPLPNEGPRESPGSAGHAPPPDLPGPAFRPTRPNSNLAVASMVLGLVALLGGCSTGVLALAAIPGVICGHRAKREIRQSRGQLDGDGLATAGLVTSYIVLAFGVLLVVFFLILFAIGFSIDLPVRP